jgi:predicted dinucleotide-binding enzyme
MKKIGVIGSGIVGQVLANGFIKHGYKVMIGTNDAAKHETLKTKVSGAAIGNFEQTAKYGELIVLAVKGHAALEVLKKAGKPNLNGKTVIDATNPIDEKTAPDNGVLHFFTNLNSSLMEQLQQAIPEANFVKSFSCVGNALMVNPYFGTTKPTMFICGNHDAAKAEVVNILDQFGWDVEDMGKAEAARAIEPLCILWCIPGFIKNQWMHAFKLLKK